MSQVKVGLLSGVSSSDGLEANYDLLKQTLDHCPKIDVVCTGELFLLRPLDSGVADAIWAQLEGLLEDIQQLADLKDTAILVGYPYKSNQGITIRQSVFFPNQLPFHYDKVHLGKNEKNYFSAGEKIQVFYYKNFCFGIQVCIDTHVPDMTLMQKILGAEVVLAPFNTPYSTEKRIENWHKYIPSKAYGYNLCVCCTNTGGGSFAVDGYGRVHVASEAMSGLQIMTIDKEKSYNKKIDYMSYRRPDLYQYE
jgi:predicted amidohydrolase